VYVGSAESEDHDQELDSVLVGPINVGSYKIVFQVRNNSVVAAPGPARGGRLFHVTPASTHTTLLDPITVAVVFCLHRHLRPTWRRSRRMTFSA